MSSNITACETQKLNAKIHTKDLKRLIRKYFNELPEINFLSEHEENVEDAQGYVKLESFEWMYGGSGNTYDDLLLKEIVPYVFGRVEAIFQWCDGEWQTGLIVEDGKIIPSDIIMKVVPKEKKAKKAKKK